MFGYLEPRNVFHHDADFDERSLIFVAYINIVNLLWAVKSALRHLMETWAQNNLHFISHVRTNYKTNTYVYLYKFYDNITKYIKKIWTSIE